MGSRPGTARNPDAHFVPVSDQDDLERLLATSSERPIVLFKHDFACPVSVRAFHELAAIPGEAPLIDVERQQGLAAEVAT
jgi:hypothetical protein